MTSLEGCQEHAARLVCSDVHVHLTDPAYAADLAEVIARAEQAGVRRMITNGLEPVTNAQALALQARWPAIRAAAGIYPLDGVAAEIAMSPWPHPFAAPAVFDVADALHWIHDHAGSLVAIGEVGLDGHWAPSTLPAQVRVLEQVCELALQVDLPLILHSRRAEAETLDVVERMGVRRALFHCFGGRRTLAVRIAEAGYFLSIPANVVRNDGFQSFVRRLPKDRLLAETDGPYLSPVPGSRNEPMHVAAAVEFMAGLRGVAPEEWAEQLESNGRTLFRW
jgi:TatD DNase family protein